MSFEKKDSSLADKINDIITAVPETCDSEKYDIEETLRIIDQLVNTDADDEILRSALRTATVEPLYQRDNKYRGMYISRQELYGECSSDDDEKGSDKDKSLNVDENAEKQDVDNEKTEAEADPDNEDDGGGDLSGDEAASDDNVDSGDEITSSDDGEIDEDNPLYRNRKNIDQVTTMTQSNVKRDAEKGECVRQQLKLWENFLEIRIQMQKCLVISNKMPQFDVCKNYIANKNLLKTQKEVKNKLSTLLDNLLEIQERILKINPETKHLLTNKGNSEDKKMEEDDPMDEEIASDTDDEVGEGKEVESELGDETSDEPPRKKQKRTLGEYEKILDDNHRKFIPYRNLVIQKWNDKTRVASGKMDKSTAQPIVKQIDFLLSDKNKLVRKTQLKRSEYKIIGKKSSDEPDEDGRRVQEYDPEIYDDDDFYHQLLRELIEQKSADITDPVQLSKQWIQLQNLRNKMKKKVDTRATKGRRLRYNVHSKLVNFMAPITVNDTWSEQAKTELNSSLFGKIKDIEDKSSEINDNNTI